MINVNSVMDCCGCSACVDICPKKCITFKVDSEGFWYPQVSSDQCVDCGMCDKVCPVLNQECERVPLKVYAAKNKNSIIRQESASGGMFTLIAERIIKEGGVVFGVKFDEDWNVVYAYTETIEGLSLFRKSKYVQAWVGDSFLRVRDFLDAGRHVLFTGTPCQIAGLRRFLRKEYENLVLLDLICEGVPSPKVWKRYLKEEFHKLIKENSVSSHSISEKDVFIKDISFRNKSLGWKKFSFALTLAKVSTEGEKNSVLLSYVNRDSAFMRSLFVCLALRPICYECPFKSCKSHSDITIADYWGINVLHPEMDDDLGTSMVHLHTEKGIRYFDLNDVDYIETSYEEAFKFNNITKSSQLHCKRDYFFSHLENRKSVINLMNELSIPHYYLRFYSKRILGKHIVKWIRSFKEIIKK